ncbi:hypothetical protein B0I35DRAFT_426344 [Stachybotrys elegans]|uniref:Uncharacterized protein n=1 Tax=Stachybotrys elegans TaxID=80388 RepID=A0A8K0SW64_9HYPO|nr:hypothetical protein B0I35DRAFT_426344 [Stachybotrys elegans]
MFGDIGWLRMRDGMRFKTSIRKEAMVRWRTRSRRQMAWQATKGHLHAPSRPWGHKDGRR